MKYTLSFISSQVAQSTSQNKSAILCLVLMFCFLLRQVKGSESMSNIFVLLKATDFISTCLCFRLSPKWGLKGTASVSQKGGLNSYCCLGNEILSTLQLIAFSKGGEKKRFTRTEIRVVYQKATSTGKTVSIFFCLPRIVSSAPW